MTYSRLSFFFVLIVFILSGFLSAQEQQDTTITITGEGDVGIGTTTPSQKLTVDGYLRMVGDNRLMLGGPFSGEYIYNPNGGTLRIHVGSDDRITISNNGFVGVGTTTPFGNLHVHDDVGDARLDMSTSQDNAPVFMRFFHSDNVQVGAFGMLPVSNVMKLVTGGDFVSSTNGLILDSDGNLGIGTSSPMGALDVNGAIYQRGEQLHADYVFDEDYELESIDEHAAFMWQHKHLKAIPKARADKNGREIIEAGRHRRGMLEELEKAHIYIEQLHNRIKKLEATVKKLTEQQDNPNN